MIGAGDTFSWRGADLPYLLHPYNTTALNERAVEVPIAQAFLEGRTEFGLEVGHVLGHYIPGRHHLVVDLYEPASGVWNVDLFEVTGQFEWIVAVSTLEHVGCGEGGVIPEDPDAPADAVAHLRSLLAPGGSMLVTVPFGQHPYLDKAILYNGLGATEEATILWDGETWTVKDGARSWREARPQRWANAVWIAEWHT